MVVAALSLAASLWCVPPSPTARRAMGLYKLPSSAEVGGSASPSSPDVASPSGGGGGPGAVGHRFRFATIILASVGLAVSLLAVITPWLVQSVGGVTITIFLEHQSCSGSAVVCGQLSGSIVEQEAACAGNAACIAQFAYYHVSVWGE